MAILGRSRLRGELTLAELAPLLARFDEAAPLLDEDRWDGSAYDAVLVEGDLRLPSLETSHEALGLLVVTGDLVVDGLYRDTDDPATGVFVLGSMRARDVVTVGSLGVAGDLEVAEALVGFYNDYSAEVHGRVRARVWAPENHHFALRHPPTVELVLGEDAAYRVPEALRAAIAPLAIEALVPRLLPELVTDEARGLDPEDLADLGFEDAVDFGALMAAVRRGERIVR